MSRFNNWLSNVGNSFSNAANKVGDRIAAPFNFAQNLTTGIVGGTFGLVNNALGVVNNVGGVLAANPNTPGALAGLASGGLSSIGGLGGQTGNQAMGIGSQFNLQSIFDMIGNNQGLADSLAAIKGDSPDKSITGKDIFQGYKDIAWINWIQRNLIWLVFAVLATLGAVWYFTTNRNVRVRKKVSFSRSTKTSTKDKRIAALAKARRAKKAKRLAKTA
jgi:hypothetical protein